MWETRCIPIWALFMYACVFTHINCHRIKINPVVENLRVVMIDIEIWKSGKSRRNVTLGSVKSDYQSVELAEQFPMLQVFKGKQGTVIVHFADQESWKPIHLTGFIGKHMYRLRRRVKRKEAEKKTYDDDWKQYDMELVNIPIMDKQEVFMYDEYILYSGPMIHYVLNITIVVDQDAIEMFRLKHPTKDQAEATYTESLLIINMVQRIFDTIEISKLNYRIKVSLQYINQIITNGKVTKEFYSKYIRNNVGMDNVNHVIFITNTNNGKKAYTFFKGVCLAQNGMSVLRYTGKVVDWFLVVTLIIRNLGGGHCNKNMRNNQRGSLNYCDALEIFKLLTGGIDNEPPRTCLLDKLDKEASWKKCSKRNDAHWTKIRTNVFTTKLDEYCWNGIKKSKISKDIGVSSGLCTNLMCNHGVVDIPEGGICGVCGEMCNSGICVTPRDFKCADLNASLCAKRLKIEPRMCFLPGAKSICCGTCLDVVNIDSSLVDTPYFDKDGKERYKNSSIWRPMRCFHCNSSVLNCKSIDHYRNAFVKCIGGCWTKRIAAVGTAPTKYERGCLPYEPVVLEGCQGKWIKSKINKSEDASVKCCKRDLCNSFNREEDEGSDDMSPLTRQTSIILAYVSVASLIGIKVVMMIRKSRSRVKSVTLIEGVNGIGKPKVVDSTQLVKNKGDIDPMEELANMLYAVQPNTIEMGNEVQAALEIQRDNIRAKLAARLVKEENEKKGHKDTANQSVKMSSAKNQKKFTEGSADTADYNANNYTEPGTIEAYYP